MARSGASFPLTCRRWNVHGTLFRLAGAAALLAFSPHVSATLPIPIERRHAQKLGLDLTSIDPRVRPGHDFNRFANGGGLDRIVIAPDRVIFSPLSVLADVTEKRIKLLVENAAADTSSSRGNAAKMGLLYRSFMDEGRVEARSADPIKADMYPILAARNKEELVAVMSRDGGGFHTSVVQLMIQPHPKNPARYVVMFRQPVLGLPDREYYLSDQHEKERVAYAGYMTRLLNAAGLAKPPVASIIRFETDLANSAWSATDRRDPVKSYNPVNIMDLKRVAPGLPWSVLLKESGLIGIDSVVLTEKSAIVKAAAAFSATDLPTLQAWALFRMLDNAAPYLSSTFADPHFQFRSATIGGVKERQPRWKRAVEALNEHMSDAVGQAYVEKHFSAQHKHLLESLVGDLRGAMKRRIESADWMSPSTKGEALKKLAGLQVEVGYPEKWRDYSRTRIDAGDLYGNIRRLRSAGWRYEAARRNKPVDKGEWALGPQFATAYNISVFNKIVFPAAILQAPFFDPAADAAVNYGAIGAVIGHEITHNFDDKGRRLDASGTLRDWWTEDDAQRFEARSKKLVQQYSNYEALPGLKVNGALTVGENIADLGGVLTALDAYHESLGGRAAPVIAGLTGDQRFFLSWAQVWRSKRREQFLREMVVSHPHAPDEFRVNGVLPHVDKWYEAFGVNQQDAMYRPPEERVRIW